MKKTGAQILVQSLIDQGVDTIFGYPGGAVLNIYDALYARRGELRHVLVSHEQGAAHAADGYARSTARTGVVLATSGPGATNLVTGLATAYHDSVPVVAITGNVPRDLIGRDSFQEVDIVSITNSVVKHNFFLQDVDSIAETVRRAFEIANSGRKGPVLVDIPRDLTVQEAEFVSLQRFTRRPDPHPEPEQFAHVARLLTESERPLLYCGGGVTFSDAAGALEAFVEKTRIPVCMSMMGLSSLPSASHYNLGLVGMHGTPTANMAVSRCDLLITVGARFSDRVAGSRAKFAKNARIVHIDIDKSEFSKNVLANETLIGDAKACLAELTRLLGGGDTSAWMNELMRHKAQNALPDTDSSDVNPREVIRALGEIAGEDAIVVTDVGQHQMLVAQHYRFQKPHTFLSSCGLGTMGYGMGAANGAAIGNPQKRVALVTGDGSFHMNLNELAVSVSENLPIVVVVMNNRVLGMVHQWQKLFCGGRYSATEIDRRTDFVKLAEAFGAKGLRVETAEDIRPALTEAFASGRPCVVDCAIAARTRVFPIIPPGGSETDMIYTED